MISKNLKVFEIEGEKYQFDIDEFKRLFAERSARQRKKIGDYEQEMGDFLFVGKDTVHNWRNKLNGPGDFDKIRGIANFLRCDVMNLMKKVVEDDEMNVNTVVKLNDRQRDAVKRVYLSMQNYIREYKDSLGFTYATENTPEKYTIEWAEDDTVYIFEEIFDDFFYEMIVYPIENEVIDIPYKLWSELHDFAFEELRRLGFWTPEIYDILYPDTDRIKGDDFFLDKANNVSHKLITLLTPYL